jgi:hypothetical protein
MKKAALGGYRLSSAALRSARVMGWGSQSWRSTLPFVTVMSPPHFQQDVSKFAHMPRGFVRNAMA